jgi:hypothetical protein
LKNTPTNEKAPNDVRKVSRFSALRNWLKQTRWKKKEKLIVNGITTTTTDGKTNSSKKPSVASYSTPTKTNKPNNTDAINTNSPNSATVSLSKSKTSAFVSARLTL